MQREPAAPKPAVAWLDTAAAARRLGREPGTLRGWRSIGKGPAFHLVSGQFVRYHVDDLDAFVKGRRQSESLSSPLVQATRSNDADRS